MRSKNRAKALGGTGILPLSYWSEYVAWQSKSCQILLVAFLSILEVFLGGGGSNSYRADSFLRKTTLVSIVCLLFFGDTYTKIAHISDLRQPFTYIPGRVV